MLQAIGLEKRYGEKLLFEGLNWQIVGTERIGLVGPNGAGKTTLLNILAGRLEPDAGSVVRVKGARVGLLAQELHVEGNRSVIDEVLLAASEVNDLARAMQAAEHTLATVTEQSALDATMAEYARLRDRYELLGGDHVEVEARRVLGGLGFTDEELSHPVSKFSGGWRMRVSLARLLVSRPDVLLLDEPTNHLDLESLAWLEGYLGGYPGVVVTVSHDRYFLNRTATRIAELTYRGVKVYVGNYDAWLVERERDKELLEKRVAEQAAEIERIEKFIDRFRAKATKAAAVQSRVKQLEKIERIETEPTGRHMRGFRFPQPPRSARTVATLDQVRKAYGDKVVYDGLTLQVERGQRIALVGVNGAGKSTLLKVLAGSLPIEGGRLALGHGVTVGYYAQHQLDTLNPAHSVIESMADVADIETYPLIRGILGAFLFSGDSVEKPISVLSGGEKARVALGRLLLRPVTMLLMDEPTNHLDLESRAALEDALRRYEGTLVVVSHDRYFMNAVATHVLEVDSGAAHGRPSTVEWHLGTYDEYLAKKAAEALAISTQSGVAKAGVGKLGSAKSEPAGKGEGEDEKARRRREAEERQRIHHATRQFKVDLEKAEKAIEVAESRLIEIDARLADPAVYASGEAPKLLRERQVVTQAVEDGYAAYATADAKIAAATQAVRGG